MSDDDVELESPNVRIPALEELKARGYLRINDPSWQQFTQYRLLHFAAQLARQLEAAGAPEGKLMLDPMAPYLMRFVIGAIWVYVHDDGIVTYRREDDPQPFKRSERQSWRWHVQDPLPPLLLAAIKETA